MSTSTRHLAGDIPLRLSSADVWQLMRDGFNANEIAYMACVSVAVALGMMAEAMPRAMEAVAA